MRLESLGQVLPRTFDWVNQLKDKDHDFPVLGLLVNNGSYLFPPHTTGSSSHTLPADRIRLLLSQGQEPDYYVQTPLGSTPVREARFYYQSDGYNCGPYSIMHSLSVTGQPTKFSLTTERIRQRANELRVENGQNPLSSPTEWFSFDDIRNILRDTLGARCKTAVKIDQKAALDPKGNSCLSYDEVENLLECGEIACMIINVDGNHFYTCVPTPNLRYIILDSLEREPEVIAQDTKNLVRTWSERDGRYYNKEFIVIAK